MIPALYSDDDILIIDKPSGLAVQPGEGVRICVIDAVERDYGFRPYLVHRLDRETAGCLVVARSSRAAARMSALMGGNGALKAYRAVVAGKPEPASGVYRDDVQVRGVEKSAETRYRTIHSDGRLSLVEAELGSGRMHQIRQHFAKAGHPIAGDDRHGDFRMNKVLAKEFGIKRLMLYAARLSLPLATPVEVEAGLPPHFADFYARWGYGGGV
jgi:23S rRNA pseudouridine955/2504/2580 synthase